MLRIEKLFIQGFKSFCDPTEVVFDEEGITAVVGPNGCGKSNVADAISWVIGEQRAKALRGGKMEDVIFQGSKNRQPSGMAEVMLTMVVRETFELKNESPAPEIPVQEAQAQVQEPQVQVEEEEAQGEGAPAPEATEVPEAKARRRRAAPPPLQRIFHEGERVTVGRRLYRTGESEYEMNGRQCRLRDVQDLFSGTGLGGAHYAIIEQGRIGQVLSAKPLDRRALIEEAAGVSKFKMRQHSAELKLEASKQNLARITDILIEIERQQNSLKRQAGKARRYQRLKQEMRDLMRAIFVVDYRVTNQAIVERESLLGGIAGQEATIAGDRQRLEEEQATAVQVARAAETVLNETRQIAAGVDVETERARQQSAYLQEQLQTLAARRGQTSQEQTAIGERRAFLEQEFTRLRGDLQTVEEEINRESAVLTSAEDDHRAQSGRDQQAEARLEERRKAAYESMTHLERWRQLQRQFTESVDRALSRLSGLGAERERALAQAQAAIERHEELRLRTDEFEMKHAETGERLSEIGESLRVLRQTREDGQARLNTLHRDMTATEHRLKSLHELDERRAYFSEAVQALMTRDPQLNGFKTLGTLADYVQVSSRDESMIEAALRDELQYIVVPTFDDALKAIDFLQAEGAGRATFLVVGMHGAESEGRATDGNGHSPNYRTLDSLLGLRTEFADAFRLALPGLAKARVVEDTAQAISASFAANGNGNGNGHLPLTTLSLTGERIVAGRLISGGSKGEKALGVLALKREIHELTERMASIEEEARRTEFEVEQASERVAQAEEEQRTLDSALRQIDKQLAVFREQLQQCERERERTGTHIRVVEQETQLAEQEKADFEARLNHATAEMEKAEAARREAEEAVAVAQTEVAEFRRLAEDRAQRLSRGRAEFAARTERRRGLQNDLRRLESETSELENRLSRLRFESLEIDETVQQAQTAMETAGEQLVRLNEQQRQLAIELEERTLQLTSARERLEALEAALRAARDSAAETREARAQQEIDLARLTSNLEHLIQTCHVELGENLVEVCERLAQQPPAPEEATEIPSFQVSDRLLDESEEETEAPAGEIHFWHVPDNFDLEAAKARLAEVTSKIDALGPINMMALDELNEIEERFHFLTTQNADLEKAIADTQAAIAEIKRRSRERFQDAFTQINENFKQMFQELFGGGHGEMRLIDPNDLLESGIEIIAQPPGKRLQNVLLLSGGEKAMAALSLVMAIFKYRPSPFCLLDEVDAPLDEMNIGRFSDKVVQMSTQTQFMIITHSKRTMEVANTLYGVTMEDPGVSKLISVKLT